MSKYDSNPFVGPRTFEETESHLFFGRQRESRDLLSLVVSERLVLFYAQSGAGKSSLINTRLIPDLTTKAFEVLPVGRVGGDLPPGIDPDNVFSYNLMLSLDRSEKNIERFAQLILTDFLANLVVTNGKCYYDDGETLEATDDDSNDEGYEIWPRALIIDQFEEILTTNLQAWKEREGFFRQLCQGMEDDPYLWIILVIREDFVAGLDPYAYLLPNKLRARFHMQRMSYEAALEAVKKPAKKYGCPFAPGVAEILVDNLRQIRVLGTTTTSTGQFVEPVQLQVVCHQLWENLKERLADQITEQDLEDAGDVDTALATFYEQAIRKTLPQTDILEAELRNWFDQKLITEAGTRGTVYQGATDTAGLPNLVVRLLANQFLLRADIRAGSTWYELVHDRFIEPILQANRAWWQKQDPVIRAVHAGKESSKDEKISGPVAGGTLRIGLYQDFTGLLPNTGGGGWPLFVVADSFYDSLLEYDDKLQLQPGLAKTWEFDDDNKTIVLHLHKGVVFHDGTPFDAEAVKVNLNRYVNPTRVVIWDLTDELEGVEIIDQYNLKLHLTEPNVNFLYNLTQDPGQMISPTALKEKGEAWLNRHPVGTGPFMFNRWKFGAELVIVRNPNYWREGLPYLDRIEWKILVDNTARSIALVTDQIDLETFIPPKDYTTLHNMTNVDLWVQPGGLAMVTFNHVDPPFNIKENREAIRYAINYEAIRDKVYYGLSDLPTGGLFPTGMWPYDSSLPKMQRNLQRARELLAMAGNPSGFTVEMIYEPDDIGQQLADITQTSLAEVGIQVNHSKTCWDRFIEILQYDRGATQMAIYVHGRMRVNAEEYFINDWTTDGSNAFANWRNEEFDQLVNQAKRTFDHNKRLRLIRQAERIFIQEVAGVPLAYPPFIHATSKRVQEYSIHPAGELNFRWLWLKP